MKPSSPRPLGTLVALFLLGALACAKETPAPSPAQAPPSTSLPPEGDPPAQDRLEQALASQDPAERSHALALAVPLARRLGPGPWLDALTSPHPGVRVAAAAALPRLRPPPPTDRLVRALAAESRPANQAALLRALARLPDPTPHAFVAALSHPEPALREAACLALAAARLPRTAVPYAAIARLMDHQPDAEDRVSPPQVRFACAHALAQLPTPAEETAATALVHDLDAALEDPEPDVRLEAATALARYPRVRLVHLSSRLQDDDWRVAAAAYQALAVHAEPDEYDDALERLAVATSEAHAPLGGPRLRVWESALRAGASLPSDAQRVRWAETQLAAFAEGPLERAPSPSLGAAHCELAAFIDAQRRWPSRLRACGDGYAPARLTYFHEARVVVAQPSSEALRANYLLRMLERGPEARAAVLSAARRVRHSTLLPALIHLARDGTDADLGRVAQVALELSPLLPRDDPQRAQLAAALQAGLDRLPPAASAATHIAALRALTTLDPPQASAAVQALAQHPNPDIAREARSRLAALLDPDELSDLPPPPEGALPRLPGATPLLVLHIPGGPVRILLEPDQAPTAAPLLWAAVQSGWLQDAPITVRAQPPEARLGDPYDSLPFEAPVWVRPDFSAGPCEAGSVVLIPAGRDSHTLALRVLLSRRPDLDAIATRVGRVTQGLDTLAAAVHGQVIAHVEALTEP